MTQHHHGDAGTFRGPWCCGPDGWALSGCLESMPGVGSQGFLAGLTAWLGMSRTTFFQNDLMLQCLLNLPCTYHFLSGPLLNMHFSLPGKALHRQGKGTHSTPLPRRHGIRCHHRMVRVLTTCPGNGWVSNSSTRQAQHHGNGHEVHGGDALMFI